jgi:hypothetical protein
MKKILEKYGDFKNQKILPREVHQKFWLLFLFYLSLIMS